MTRQQLTGWLWSALDRFGFPTAALVVVGMTLYGAGTVAYKDIVLPMIVDGRESLKQDRAIKQQQADALTMLADGKEEHTRLLTEHTELLSEHTEILGEINSSQREIKAAVERLQPSIQAPKGQR